MFDFKDAFKKGQDAAMLAERNRKEIDNVFDEMNKQLSDVTGGNIEIRRAEYKVPNENPFIIRFGKPDTYWALGVFHKFFSGENKELAKWQQDRNGYPCKISLGDHEMYCEDKNALQIALSDLLSDAVVGETLYKMIHFDPPREE